MRLREMITGRNRNSSICRSRYKGSLQCEHKFDYNFLYFLPDLRSWNSVHIFIVSLTIFSTSLQLTNISMEEIISENMSKFCTGDVVIMYQLIVWAQECMALSTVHYLAAIRRQLGRFRQLAHWRCDHRVPIDSVSPSAHGFEYSALSCRYSPSTG